MDDMIHTTYVNLPRKYILWVLKKYATFEEVLEKNFISSSKNIPLFCNSKNSPLFLDLQNNILFLESL